MINMSDLCTVGFNNRRYNIHILWDRILGYGDQQLFNLSQKIINNKRNATFGEAYNYDFASAGNKESLEKFETEMDIQHKELSLPWDQPVSTSYKDAAINASGGTDNGKAK